MGLTLSRRIGERIYIGEGIVLTVTDIAYGRVRIDIECDRTVRIFREELAPPSLRAAVWRKVREHARADGERGRVQERPVRPFPDVDREADVRLQVPDIEVPAPQAERPRAHDMLES